MQATKQSLTLDLATAVDFFKTDLVAQELPFLRIFPSNSCESVSTLLGAALADKYCYSQVVRVHGRTRSDAHHLWLEVDDHAVDATAHQFPDYADPFVCSAPSPLEKTFPDVERLTAKDALARLELSFLRVNGSVRDALIARLRSRLGEATEGSAT